MLVGQRRDISLFALDQPKGSIERSCAHGDRHDDYVRLLPTVYPPFKMDRSRAAGRVLGKFRPHVGSSVITAHQAMAAAGAGP